MSVETPEAPAVEETATPKLGVDDFPVASAEANPLIASMWTTILGKVEEAKTAVKAYDVGKGNAPDFDKLLKDSESAEVKKLVERRNKALAAASELLTQINSTLLTDAGIDPSTVSNVEALQKTAKEASENVRTMVKVARDTAGVLKDADLLKFLEGFEIPVPGVRVVGGTVTATEAMRIREWATAHGYTVNSRGRIPEEVMEKYKAAHS